MFGKPETIPSTLEFANSQRGVMMNMKPVSFRKFSAVIRIVV